MPVTSKALRYDALVVGAGPGGSAAAYWLARAGATVALLDRAQFPRDKPCGDGLLPAAVAQLREMGLDDLADGPGWPYRGVRVFGADDAPPLGSWRAEGAHHPQGGLVLPRRLLDDRLRQQAMAAGAQFLPGFFVRAALREAGRLVGLEGQAQGQGRRLLAPLIILATGANRSLLPLFSLEPPARPQALATRGYVERGADFDDALEVYLDPALLPGYGWIFPTGRRTANIGVGVALDDSPAAGRSRLRAAFGRLLGRPALRGATLIEEPQGYPLRTDFLAAPTHAAGLLLVGETAGLVDPLTGEGIGLALESGRLAATVAATALALGDPSAARLAAYGEALAERYGGLFRDAHELLDRLSSPAVVMALLDGSRHDRRIGEALRTAIVDQQPRASIAQLDAALAASAQGEAHALFTLNSYRPWIERCRAYLVEQVRRDSPDPAVVELVGRGKMLRALLVFIGCRAAGGEPAQVLSGAGGIELVHAASLVHDDLIDRADRRRGLPALHKTLGEARALVCGDYLIAKSFRLLAESRHQSPDARVVEAFIIGAESGVRACVGQFHDSGGWTAEGLSEAEYDRLIGDKTAAVISGALRAGAALAGADPALLEALARYGEHVGRAFQIKDDLLDLVDLAQGQAIDHKISLPLVHAFQHADEPGRRLILAFLAEDSRADRDLGELLARHGSLGYAERTATAQAEAALRLATTIPRVAGELAAFATYAVRRGA